MARWFGIWSAVILWGAQVSAQPVNLETQARMSARPPGCQASLGIWAGARHQALVDQCARLALAHTVVTHAPAQARDLTSVGTVVPELRHAFELLNARQRLAEQNALEAFERFESLQRKQTGTTWDPVTLHDYARSAALSGHDHVAADLYRKLFSVSAWLGTPRRLQLSIEAAASVLRLDPPSTQEALSFLDRVAPSTTDTRLRRVAEGLAGVARLLRNQGVLPIGDELVELEPVTSFVMLPSGDWAVLAVYWRWNTSGDPAVWAKLQDASVGKAYQQLARDMLRSRVPSALPATVPKAQ